MGNRPFASCPFRKDNGSTNACPAKGQLTSACLDALYSRRIIMRPTEGIDSTVDYGDVSCGLRGREMEYTSVLTSTTR
jgi:hypothetical protein